MPNVNEDPAVQLQSVRTDNENVELMARDWIGLHLTAAAGGETLGLRGYDLKGNEIKDALSPTEIPVAGTYSLDAIAVSTFGFTQAELSQVATWEFYNVVGTITLSHRRPTTPIGTFPHTYDASTDVSMGTLLSGFQYGFNAVQPARELSAYTEAALTVAEGTRTITFACSKPDNWVLLKWNAVATGTVTSTLRYSTAEGVSEYPTTATRTSSASDNTLNAITYKGLYPGNYTLTVATATNEIQSLVIAVQGFDL